MLEMKTDAINLLRMAMTWKMRPTAPRRSASVKFSDGDSCMGNYSIIGTSVNMKWPNRILFLSVFGAVFFYASFFWTFEKTLSYYSGRGFLWTVQLFYNLLHGRPFQSSLYAATGLDVGF